MEVLNRIDSDQGDVLDDSLVVFTFHQTVTPTGTVVPGAFNARFECR